MIPVVGSHSVVDAIVELSSLLKRQDAKALDALETLNERERRVFEARRLSEDPLTLEQLSTEFGVSRERIRQIEVRAFEKVQKAVRSRVADMEAPAASAARPIATLVISRQPSRTSIWTGSSATCSRPPISNAATG